MPSSRRPGASQANGKAMRVVIGLGGNMRHGRHGRPADVLRAAASALAGAGLDVRAMAPVRDTAPLGPSARRYANSAILAYWSGSPVALLALVKGVERDFGRRRGRRWGARVLDCDILLIERQIVSQPGLDVPHPRLAERHFVLDPLLALWPDWRHPRSGLGVRHLRARLGRSRPVDSPSFTA